MDSKKYKIETRLAHLGRNSKKYSGNVNTPIFRTSTVLYENFEKFSKKDEPIHTNTNYGRNGTDTVHALENALKDLEGAEHCILTSSGMSAIALVFSALLKHGDHVLITDATYKCTRRFAEEEFPRLGITYDLIDTTDAINVKNHIKKNTKLIFLESPGSGTFEIIDVGAICEIAKKHHIPVCVDNSWATTLNFRPLEHGADISMQSLTKYMNGHSDVIMGSLAFSGKVSKRIYQAFRNYAPITSPEDCYLVLRGMRTVAVRIKEQAANALVVAKWLDNHPKVIKVLYPPLESFKENHENWKKFYNGATSTFGIELKTQDKTCLVHFIDSLKLFGIGLSWGGFESLVMLYQVKNLQNSEKRAFSNFHIRFNIGLESSEDLIHDLDNALKNIK